MRGATWKNKYGSHSLVRFQSTLLMRGATSAIMHQNFLIDYFNPRSSCEERLKVRLTPERMMYFNPRSSCEERLCYGLFGGHLVYYFNPRSSCEERRDPASKYAWPAQHFNPRSSCEERPLWVIRHSRYRHFNPRSSCEERPLWVARQECSRHFNPRSSCEERRLAHRVVRCDCRISIHAPHARSDDIQGPTSRRRRYFNPRSSCEERRGQGKGLPGHSGHFNPRSSCEERRRILEVRQINRIISIHAPHARSDTLHIVPVRLKLYNFNPRSSCEERQSHQDYHLCTHGDFNPRSSCEERLCYFQALICLTSSYIFREPLTSFRKHFF